jgi:glycosyltransferase involved in cell wall biosynthesis
MHKVEAHCITYNEEAILPYWLRHYATFCSKMVVHDSGSTDRTVELAKSAGAEVRTWDSGDRVNDRLMAQQKNEGWLGTDADWVTFSDADELVYFPMGVEPTLDAYDKRCFPMIKCHGWELVRPVFPSTIGQIYDEVKIGARDDRWYGKPCLFNPRLVKSIEYGMGAHDGFFTHVDGTRFTTPIQAAVPPTYLLHFKHIDSVENIGRKYDAYRARFSDINIENGWGCHKDGIEHAREKRRGFMARIERVIP